MKRALLAIVTSAALSGASLESEGKRWWAHVEALASDAMDGRNTGSEAHRRAAQYVAAQFERAGLQAAGVEGYIQPVPFDVRRLVEAKSRLELIRGRKAQRLTLGDDAIIGTRSEPAPFVEARLVFAGYGFTVPELQYDDLAGDDLRGKVIVTISGAPSNIPGPLRAHYQSAVERDVFLRKAGVVGVVSIPNPREMDIPWSRLALARLQPTMALADKDLSQPGSSKISVMVNPERAGPWLAGTGHTLDELLALASAGKPLPRFAIPAKLRARTVLERSQVESQNVAGLLPGSDARLRGECIVLTAHLDHVGTGEPIAGDRIYNGAMDNASGVASLIEIAHHFHTTKAQPKRTVLFVAVTGEEKGLLGSRFYAAHPTVPPAAMVANVNMDMFLPIVPMHSVIAFGLKESTLGDSLRAVASRQGIEVKDDPEPARNLFVRSDQYSFIRRGIPAIALSVGFEKGSPEEQTAKKWLHDRYHAPSDDLKQPVNLDTAAAYNRLLIGFIEAVASQPERPRWRSDSFFRRFAR